MQDKNTKQEPRLFSSDDESDDEEEFKQQVNNINIQTRSKFLKAPKDFFLNINVANLPNLAISNEIPGYSNTFDHYKNLLTGLQNLINYDKVFAEHFINLMKHQFKRGESGARKVAHSYVATALFKSQAKVGYPFITRNLNVFKSNGKISLKIIWKKFPILGTKVAKQISQQCPIDFHNIDLSSYYNGLEYHMTYRELKKEGFSRDFLKFLVSKLYITMVGCYKKVKEGNLGTKHADTVRAARLAMINLKTYPKAILGKKIPSAIIKMSTLLFSGDEDLFDTGLF